MYEFLKFLKINLPQKQNEVSLADILPQLLTELYYPSESDEPIEAFSLAATEVSPLTKEDFINLMELDENTCVEALNVETFWSTVTDVKEWYGAEQIATATKFSALRDLLSVNLHNIQGFRVGEIEVNVYLFGKNSDGKLEGIKTMLVET